MKKFKKAVALICAALMLTSAVCVGAADADASLDTGIDYTINNPYKDVDWLNYKQYKADLHSHTTASDGSDTLKDMTEAHYAAGFDIVAVSDHGVTDYGWIEQNYTPALRFFIKAFKDGRGQYIEDLDYSGTAANGNTYKYEETKNGDYYTQYDANGNAGQAMMRVPFANEHNPTSINNAHVNSWFVDWGDGRLGGTSDYITPIKTIDEMGGGLTVINHPGEYTNARDEIYAADAYNIEDIAYNYKINKFAGLLTDYESCIGVDMNSKGDGRTRFDRKLWDILLQRVVPTGRNVLGIATSDAHSTGVVYTGYTMMCMESNTVENLYNCMKNGEFFAASKNLGNYEELKEIADFLTKETDPEKKAMGEELTKIYKNIEVQNANGEDGDGYEAPADVDAPTVNAVIVSDELDTITLVTSADALNVRWIADGECIATGNTIDLDDYSDSIGSYVRAEIFGKGGIVYTQPFTLEYDGAPEAQDNSYIDLWFLASFIPDNIVRLVGMFPFFQQLLDLIGG